MGLNKVWLITCDYEVEEDLLCNESYDECGAGPNKMRAARYARDDGWVIAADGRAYCPQHKTLYRKRKK